MDTSSHQGCQTEGPDMPTTDAYVTGKAHREAVAHVPVAGREPMETPHAVLAVRDAGEYTSLLLTLHSRVEQLAQRASNGMATDFDRAELDTMRDLLNRLRQS